MISLDFISVYMIVLLSIVSFSFLTMAVVLIMAIIYLKKHKDYVCKPMSYKDNCSDTGNVINNPSSTNNSSMDINAIRDKLDMMRANRKEDEDTNIKISEGNLFNEQSFEEDDHDAITKLKKFKGKTS